MTKSQDQNRSEAAGQDEFFNLQTSGCGYLSRVRWVDPKAGRGGRRGGGRTGEPFLACAINALHGRVSEPNYTYFDLRVSGEEAIGLIEQLQADVDARRKVFVAFKIGDIYSHPYERKAKDDRGRETGELELASCIKGRLLLITHIKVDGEEVYSRAKDDDGADGQVPHEPQGAEGSGHADSGDSQFPEDEQGDEPPAQVQRRAGGSANDAAPPAQADRGNGTRRMQPDRTSRNGRGERRNGTHG